MCQLCERSWLGISNFRWGSVHAYGPRYGWWWKHPEKRQMQHKKHKTWGYGFIRNYTADKNWSRLKRKAWNDR